MGRGGREVWFGYLVVYLSARRSGLWFRCLIGMNSGTLVGQMAARRATVLCVLGWAQAKRPFLICLFLVGVRFLCCQVGVKPIRSYSDKMLAEEVKKAIIVIKGGITPFARSAIMELCAQREVSIYASMLRGGVRHLRRL